MRTAIVGWSALLILTAACDAPAPPGGSGTAWFRDVAASRGIDFVHRTGHRERLLFPESIAGGAALFDMDGDGDLDAYLVQGGVLEGDTSKVEGNRLYENDGTGQFTDVSASSGADDRGYGMGVAVGDYDNDGDSDLYVTNYGPNTLLRNEGGGRFVDVTAESGAGDPAWGTSAAFFDYDADGDLDLFVVNYVNWTMANEHACYNSSGVVDYCLPTNYNAPAADVLLRNEGNGRFTDVSEAAGIRRAFGNGLGVLYSDFDGDGNVDVFVANDTMVNQLWLGREDGTFVDEAMLRGCALDQHGMAKAGMGVAAKDFDDDGDTDLLVVNIENQTDSFFRNDNGFFKDFTGEIGLGTESRRFTRFGIGMLDFDNDGHLDLYEANGRVNKSAEPLTEDPFAEPNMLFAGGEGGRLTEVSPQGGTLERLVHTSRGAAFGDVDNDGGIDVLIVNTDAAAYLLRNVVTDRGHWVMFQVLEANGRDALGARVTAGVGDRRMMREARSAYSYQASNDPRVHFGLGEATAVKEVTVRWADGVSESFGDFDADRVAVLRRGAGS